MERRGGEFDVFEVPTEYLIIFPHRAPLGQLEKELESLLGQQDAGRWQHVLRPNPARPSLAALSDFLVVRFSDESLLATLEAAAPLLQVVPQRQIGQQQNYDNSAPDPRARKLLGLEIFNDVPHLLGVEQLWNRGYTGKGVNVAVFDTGLAEQHPHFRNVAARWDFTDEGRLDDMLGHGTFVAGVISSQSDDCPGFAPDAAIHSYRVFTSKRVSFTSWFLDALNHAIYSGIDVLNLSIGGPDFLDRPFVDKILEASANDIIVVSAIGNDGPLYGTLNNPADQPDVIGVGGITFDHKVASFSSRGMTTWELPDGYGRVKPDLVAYGESVTGSHLSGGCRTLSGTSVSSPVVAGAVSLLASTVKDRQILNAGSMKQVLLEAAERLDAVNGGGNIFEQGFGQLNLLDSFEILQNYVPRASLSPSALDFTDCPYMWPFCLQPLFVSSAPLQFNVTILNGMGVSGYVVEPPKWNPGVFGDLLQVSMEVSPILWPYTGQLALRIQTTDKAAGFSGVAEGVVSLTVKSPAASGEGVLQSDLALPIRVRIIPTPPRAKRVLWDQYHNLRYPSGYFPRDSLSVTTQPFDLNGDHIHTNFRDLFTHLVEQGYYVDVLGEPFTCFDADHYGTLLVVDPEEEFFPEEVTKIYHDVTTKGLALVVFADWYNVDVIQQVKFFDENTRQWWTPATGGANVPALNDLLKPFEIALGDRVYDGEFSVNSKAVTFASGNALAAFPRGGRLLPALLYDQGDAMLSGNVRPNNEEVAVLGLLPDAGLGRVAVYGDSNLIDSAHATKRSSWWLAKSIMQFAASGTLSPELRDNLVDLNKEYVSKTSAPPSRLPPPLSSLHLFSKVIGQKLPMCAVRRWESGSPPKDAQPIAFPAPKTFAPDSTPPRGIPPLDRSSSSLSNTSSRNALIFGLFAIIILLALFAFTRRRESFSSIEP